jgi:hypothetical protein
MRGLTLHGCWAYAIAYDGKDVENRPWEIPERHLGTRIAIHAGNNPGDEPAKRGKPWPKACILATVTLAGSVADDGKYIGNLTQAQAQAALDSEWYGGPFGWVLTDLIVLPRPIPCSGALGLWFLPEPIRLQLGGAPSGTPRGKRARK